MKILVIPQGPADGTEASYNGLRRAGNLANRDGVEVTIFCFGDAVGFAVAGQQLPNGFYRLDRVLTPAARHGAEIGMCGTCMDALDVTDDMLVPETRRSTLRRGHRLDPPGRQDDRLLTVSTAPDHTGWVHPRYEALR